MPVKVTLDGVEQEVFTKEENEQLIQGRITKTKKELDEAKTLRDKQEEELRIAKEELATLKNPPPLPPGENDLLGRMKLYEEKTQKKIEYLEQQLAIEKQEKESEIKKRRLTDRDRHLSEALQKANIREEAIAIGMNHFSHQLEYYADDDKWVFNLRGGGTTSVQEGVEAEMPDFLKRSSTDHGGSGARSGSGKGTVQQAQVTALQNEVTRLESIARQSAQDKDILAWKRKKEELRAANAALKTG